MQIRLKRKHYYSIRNILLIFNLMTLAEIQQLEEFFLNAEKPACPIFLNNATKVNDYDHFIESHFAPLKADPGSRVNQPLIWRLKAMKLIIEANA